MLSVELLKMASIWTDSNSKSGDLKTPEFSQNFVYPVFTISTQAHTIIHLCSNWSLCVYIHECVNYINSGGVNIFIRTQLMRQRCPTC